MIRNLVWCLKINTWLPVSTQFKREFLHVFHNRMHLSAVPPPEARTLYEWGDQAMALTAAVCSEYLSTGHVECWFQTKSCMYYRTLNTVSLHRKNADQTHLIIVAARCQLTIVTRPLKPTHLKKYRRSLKISTLTVRMSLASAILTKEENRSIRGKYLWLVSYEFTNTITWSTDIMMKNNSIPPPRR